MLIALVGLNANAAMYIVGDDPLGGWTWNGGTLMTDNGDGTFTYKATFDGTIWFVFADGQGENWDDFNGNYRFGPVSGGNEVVAVNTDHATQKSTDGNASYQFTGTNHEYTFIFDSNNMTFRVEGIVDVPTADTYTVAGSSTALFGEPAWSATNTDNDMTLVNGLYTFTKNNVELTTSGFSFKVVYNHDWGVAYPSSNFVQAIAKHGYYNVVITFNADTKEITCTPTLVEEIIDGQDPIYTVAGAPAALFGTEWAPALVENEMTKGQDGIYTWTKNGVELTAGEVQFKVVMGHEWGQEWPSSNYVATIEENGNYNVVITFNPENQEITFNATAVEVGEDFYTVAGSPAALFGEEWNPGYAANNMTLANGLYTWTKQGVELAANTFIEFKVVKNNNWNTCWPASNYEYTVAADGTYDVTITYNPENNEVTFACVAQGVNPQPAVRGDVNEDNAVNISDVTSLIDLLLSGAEAPASADCNLDQAVNISDVTALIDYLLGGSWPAVEMEYTVVGPANVFGSEWNTNDEANNMTKGADGVYTWSKTGVTLYGNFEFKVVGNHDWSIYEWPIGMNNWVANVAEEGIYDIVITFNPDAPDADRITCTLTKTGNVEPVEHTYTVAGAPSSLFGGEWAPDIESNDMVKGADGKYTWKYEGYVATGAVEVEFKIVKDHSWDNGSWPANNYSTLIGSEGYPTTVYIVTITFDPNAADGDENKVMFSALPVQLPE